MQTKIYNQQTNIYSPFKETVLCDYFEDLFQDEDILRGIYSYGCEKPSQIQKQSLPHILNDESVIIQKQNFGIGVTSCLVLGAINKIQNYLLKNKKVQDNLNNQNNQDQQNSNPVALIVVKTRELGINIQNLTNSLCEFLSFTSKCFTNKSEKDNFMENYRKEENTIDLNLQKNIMLDEKNNMNKEQSIQSYTLKSKYVKQIQKQIRIFIATPNLINQFIEDGFLQAESFELCFLGFDDLDELNQTFFFQPIKQIVENLKKSYDMNNIVIPLLIILWANKEESENKLKQIENFYAAQIKELPLDFDDLI
ncbi:P-loop containing nucleoside triphosphate hydrolase [Pseudocohnilembus persalinus]|uniref:p-loop containing nucleoside triphosphate hydrolase n=1 Tax=Pseudocohnilembus persalinus TaxID=266149 RepID=A0A0V0QC32_PSEPJ|nr:P-loop containing nucleoside triphosphate hydrolase [Pseudocohnilembus persalinus]|eukprot:KRW99805.1 P-loop containing nucleoside triphosphate hydrolase [Pseudocohnilembus persalinus]